MSFRLFIYYCAVAGGLGAYLGWAFGRMPSLEEGSVLESAIKGMFLGMVVALALALIDALWNGTTFSQFGKLFARVGVAVLVGCLGGFFGAFIGQALYGPTQVAVFLIVGWVLTGVLIGASPGVFDYRRSLASDEDSRGPGRKVVRGVIGGAAGGLLGSVVYLLLLGVFEGFFRDKEGTFWSPSATGMVALGMCIGLLIGLAQVILREAWLKVEEGFRPGRELVVSKGQITIGRAESCDLGLFGDPKVERLHARIVQQAGRYYLVDENTAHGTFLNGQRIHQPTPLSAGDEIRVGRCVLRFGERQKKAAG